MVQDILRDPLQLRIAVGDLIALFRVGTQDLPFFFRELSRLIQDLQRNADLADVMQQAEQRQVALLDICQLDPFSQLLAHQLRAPHMVLRVAVAFLKGPDQGRQHFGMDGFPVQELFRAHGLRRRVDGLCNIR